MAAAFVCYGSIGLATGLVAGHGPLRRGASLTIALMALGLPFLVAREHTLVRALLALGAVLTIMRAIDLARSGTPVPPATRIGLMFAILDLRRVARAAASFEPSRLGLGIACLAASIASFWLALDILTQGPLLPLRWLAGAVGVYSMAEGANQLTLFGWHSAGYRIPAQLRAPVLAVSVGEFWSRRWNLNVRDWLHQHCHRPLVAARRPLTGIACAFFASALLHYWFVAVALGSRWGLLMASFFALQGVLMVVESRLRQRRWPPIARRIWTICAVGGTSPLFVEPFLRILEG